MRRRRWATLRLGLLQATKRSKVHADCGAACNASGRLPQQWGHDVAIVLACTPGPATRRTVFECANAARLHHQGECRRPSLLTQNRRALRMYGSARRCSRAAKQTSEVEAIATAPGRRKASSRATVPSRGQRAPRRSPAPNLRVLAPLSVAVGLPPGSARLACRYGEALVRASI